MYKQRRLLLVSLFLLQPCFITKAIADGSSIDKVYNPYVQPLEKELEYRFLQQRYNEDHQSENVHKFGFGTAFTDMLFGEAYVIGEEVDNQDFGIEAYELELKWQITEQGEYAVDVGSIFELEKYHKEDIWEAKIGLLAANDWHKISSLLNLYLVQEWGNDIDDETETALSLQVRYRFDKTIEPGFELFSSDGTRAIGPVVMGELRPAAQHKLFWQLGCIFGIDDETANKTIKLQLEYEFL